MIQFSLDAGVHIVVNLEKELFFRDMRRDHLALTFDDVILQTGRSHTPASEANITSFFTRELELKTPIVSAAMDTVTEHRMAIAMAKLGGLGIIHSGLDVKQQRNEVRRVKLFLSGLIDRPVLINQEQSLESVLEMCDTADYHFRTFPVIDNSGKLVGLMTGKGFEFPEDLSGSVEKAMKPLSQIHWAPHDTPIKKAYETMRDTRTTTLPLIDDEGQVTGLYVWNDVKAIVRGDTAPYNVDTDERLRVGIAVPTDNTALQRAEACEKYADVLVIDSSQGDSDFGLNTLRELKAAFPRLQVVGGNFTQGDSAVEFARAGADGVKIGQGGGSICTTRVETGTGRPQVTAVFECARALRQAGFSDLPICSDGGIAYRGAIPIAIAAGAHSVMVGLMMSGTLESAAPIFEDKNGTKWKLYRGMGSITSLSESASARARYSASEIGRLLPEGIEAAVPVKGTVADEIDLMNKALRRGLSLARSQDIPSHRENALFERVTQAGAREAHPHDVTILSVPDLMKIAA